MPELLGPIFRLCGFLLHDLAVFPRSSSIRQFIYFKLTSISISLTSLLVFAFMLKLC